MRLVIPALALAAALHAPGAADPIHAQQRPNTTAADPIEILHVRGPIYLIAGAGANIVVSAGPDGVLVTDAGSAPMSDRVLAAIQQVQKESGVRAVPPPRFAAETRSTLEFERATPAPPKPVRFIISTSIDSDHYGGTAKLAAAGRTITGGNVAGAIGDAGDAAAIYAHENVLLRMTRAGGTGEAVVPTDTYFTPFHKLSHFFNGEGVQIIHAPNAHTDGDSIVWFRTSDVIAAGDVFSTVSYPHIDLDKGGSVQGVIEALNDILDLAISEFRAEGGTMIIPGHGAISDSADIAYYRDMVTKIRDRIEDSIKKGMTLEQVKAGRPTRDYDPRYGAPTGPSSPDQFVEAVYRSLTKKTS
jgi:cyclase